MLDTLQKFWIPLGREITLKNKNRLSIISPKGQGVGLRTVKKIIKQLEDSRSTRIVDLKFIGGESAS